MLRPQILLAVSQKVKLSSSVNLDDLADQTEGFSGADLQALLYNAHLEVVHESIAALSALDRPSTRDDEASIEFAVIGNNKKGNDNVMSRAERTALQRRVSRVLRRPCENLLIGMLFLAATNR